ncbi:HD domain-containing protein [Patescibacteria group bacterium]
MDQSEIQKLYELYRTPEHIREHCSKVALVGGKIAKSISEKGIEIDVDSVIHAGLLHDILRVVDIDGDHYKELCKKAPKQDVLVWNALKKQFNNLEHPYAIYRMLMSWGEEKIASIVRKHQFEAIISPEELPFTLEEKIMTYADKRVLHAKIVSLKGRFEDGAKRYQEGTEAKRIYDKYFELEKELFALLPFAPESISEDTL